MTDKLDMHPETTEPSRRAALVKRAMGTAFALPLALSCLIGSAQQASALIVATGSGKAMINDATPPIPPTTVDKTPIYSTGTSLP